VIGPEGQNADNKKANRREKLPLNTRSVWKDQQHTTLGIVFEKL
jgi:hypothetical protein